MNPNLQSYRQRLRSSVPQVDDIFEGCMQEALAVMSERGIDAYLDGASMVSNLGRGTELVLIFLEEMPSVARIAGEEIIRNVTETCRILSQRSTGAAISAFLSLLPTCARRLEKAPQMREYFRLIELVSIEANNGLIPLLTHAETLLNQLSIGGIDNWIRYGLRTYREQPHRYGDYFSLQTADARAALQRERHGTLFVDSERKLALYLKAFWDEDADFHPYSLAFDILRRQVPYLDSKGFHLPDVYDDIEIAPGGMKISGGPLSNSPPPSGGESSRLPAGGTKISGLDRYRALLAHLAAHRAYTRPFIADNYNRFQHLFIEAFEDSRVEALAIRRFPGLRRMWLALHPIPEENACPPDQSNIRHKAAMLSRALLDPDHPYTDPVLLDFVARFHARMEQNPHDPTIATDLGVACHSAMHEPAFRLPRVWFKDTEVSYRDDNRYMWIFLEDTTDEEDFHSDHAAANPKADGGGESNLFSRHHPEWDCEAQHYRPDWVTVYETIQPADNPARIDALFEKHKQLARRLKRIVDLLKPQQHVRIRYQEDGDELDLDIALRAMVDFRSGSTPDSRIHMSHRHDGRDISVMLLLDLSQSINETPAGCESSVLQLSQEAVSLLAWAIEALGDPFAIAGFASNTRHQVRYTHFKGFTEPWGEEVKGRLAGMEGELSTRMGAAIRHAGHFLAKRSSQKKLLLVLTDGEPSDIDVDDPYYLRADTKKAVEELGGRGIATHCITLDPRADDYVADIFGRNGYTVIDHIEKLPERLPQVFMALTK